MGKVEAVEMLLEMAEMGMVKTAWLEMRMELLVEMELLMSWVG